ncbi:MAG: flagellar motor protein MotB [Phyllobacteriaceae bacterium]|nr:flagellar motor protein MotB [Phyllobacteriaceae bacterium]MBA89632.1 flagellar motor protein MotB [Phyllobacteriaceae bacterium]
MINRRAIFTLAAGAVAAAAMPGLATAQSGNSPSAATIQRRLEAAPRRALRPERRVSVEELKRRPEIRRDYAPSIDIQTINFAFGSAEIPYREFYKVEQIAIAMRNILRRRRHEIFLIEGHTDAVGSNRSNQILSEQRARSLARVLNSEFGIPWRAMETVGYGEEFLLVPVPYEEWRNRRVTLRRVTDIVRR